MKSSPLPHVALGVTSEDLTITYGPSGGTKHEVTVPAGTQCRKLDGGANPWVIADLSFMVGKNSIMRSDADIYGIRVPEAKIKDSRPV